MYIVYISKEKNKTHERKKKAKIEHKLPKIKKRLEFAAQRAKSRSWKIL